ncbi:bifunctional aspartate kinase/homoserine dehydrogenase I [Galbibacter sp. EGI 63066]|uniref:bifunctional aspartate kinase/homoserine dehydrogenase I n=1 Tax=Galbibacter sp. EGI 63066 TaxID=2993559 RepID=UPI00224983D3|nr:bifunctional aspartate kinase/homoserine dehydrogenase I [Galbibacter sp. EGI 63066]MCX2679466.1 bifunctional aspartate kinase/homoserine dehydrogenase I [Galbibacter sp. EGI 63066]
MKNELLHISLENFTTLSGVTQDLNLSYQLFGRPLHSAPIVMVNHALTGNSNVSGEDGWWKDLIGEGKAIDTDKYTVLALNIPGNGYDGFIIDNYKDFVARDVARIFLLGLEKLKVTELYALIGGSLGGGIAWEMAALKPDITQHFIPVATDWKSTDWLIANCQIQGQFLVNSKQPVHDARMHAMLCYRTPESFKERFKRTTNDELQVFNVESWLLHHGKKLQERFQLSAYKLMNQLLKTIDVTRERPEHFNVLESIQANVHIIGVSSDLFFTAEENRETHKQLAQASDRVRYGEIISVHGHDAFLIEYEQLEKLIGGIFESSLKDNKMKVLKFGGKSLANGKGINNVVDIITKKVKDGERIAVVVSARNNATDELESILDTASRNQDYQHLFEAFKKYQTEGYENLDLSAEFEKLEKLFSGISLLGDYSAKVKDEVLAQGEIISAKLLTEILKEKGIKANFTDSRKLIKTDTAFGNAQPLEKLSKKNIVSHFSEHNGATVNIVTGFIGSNEKNETTTLGRNGSNYTASLLANFLDAGELQSFTHVDGIFTANPDLVPTAQRIEELSFNEANEMANFGATILHAKTIIPLLEKNIPLRILNTFDHDNEGTLITAHPKKKGTKSLSVLENVALVNLEGRGLLGKAGVDARIFNALGKKDISVSIISQGSSERGIGLVVNAEDATEAVIELEKEFESDFYSKDVNKISVVDDVSVISIIGLDLSSFHKPYNALIKNQVVPILFNNTVTGKNVSLVVKHSELHKALNVIHGEIFEISKKVNIAIFGHGLVGGTLIDQVLTSAANIEERKKIKLNIFAVANSRKLLLDKKGIDAVWKDEIQKSETVSDIQHVIDFAKEHHLENLVAIDNTASSEFVENYGTLVENGFDLVSSNKIANTLSFDFYKELRALLEKNQKQYLYETNVGAGLPLIDTIRILHLSGENITRIRGVFSGTLSYLFNRFSSEEKSFNEILKDTIDNGFTEPDPREDLYGNDVGRKLLILARELDLHNEFEDVNIQNLVPEGLRDKEVPEFLQSLEQFDEPYQQIKNEQEEGHVLRYVGDLHGDLQQDKGELDVKLVSVPSTSVLGQVKGADSIFEIYTESYGDRPIVIQGAGAGAAVTARGVFGDILKLAERG